MGKWKAEQQQMGPSIAKWNEFKKLWAASLNANDRRELHLSSEILKKTLHNTLIPIGGKCKVKTNDRTALMWPQFNYQ